MMKNCETEMLAKVVAFEEGLEPSEVNCPVKEFCINENHCVFYHGNWDVPVSDQAKLEKLRAEIKKFSYGKGK